MKYTAFIITLIIAFSCVFAQTSAITYERENLAVLRVSGADMAHVELTNNYKLVSGKMYLQDCGLTTCYLYLTITPDQPLDARNIIGRVGAGKATYAGAQVYETRTVPVPNYIYKTVEKNYTQLNNATGKNETVFYNETVLDRTTYVDTPIANWYALDYAGMSAGRTYQIRLEYHKEPTATADLVPEIAGKRIDGWAWWSVASIPYWADSTDGVWINVSLNTTTPLQVLFNKTNTNLSNGSAVFDSWDDFTAAEGYTYGNINGQNGWVDLYGRGGVVAIPSEGVMFKNSTTATANPSFAKNTTYPANASATEIVEIKISVSSSASSFIKATAFFTTAGFSEIGTIEYKGDNTIYSRTTNTGKTWAVGVWDVFGFTQPTANNKYDVYINETLTNANLSVANNGYVNGIHMVFYDQKDDVKIDWMRVRKHSSATSVSCADLSATQTLCNITTTVNLTGYQVKIPYADLNTPNLTAEIGTYTSGSPPVLQSISFGPSSAYYNTTLFCAVNYTDDANDTFTVYQGLTINGSLIGSFNQTNSSYTNATIWNTSYDVSAYHHGDIVVCWASATDTSSPPESSNTNLSSSINISNYAPIISNVQITNPIGNGENATGSATFVDYDNDGINCRFEWFRNGTSIWNSSQSPCTNSSMLNSGNYSTSDLINFTVYANDTYTFPSNATPGYSATVTITPTFGWNNYTLTNPQYESVPYSYSVNFTLPAGNTVNSEVFSFNSMNFIPSCSNVSTTYYCTYTGVPAPLVSSNGTSITGYWLVNYTNGTDSYERNQTFSATVYYGVWATWINSSTIVPGGGPATIYVLYSNASGTTASVSGTTWLLGASSYSGGLSCSAGTCSGSINPTPSVSTATLYQVEANLTLASSFWATTQNRVVRIERTYYYNAVDSVNTSSGTVTNPSSGWDLDWTNYATLGSGGAEYFNYTFSQLYATNWTMKDSGGMRYYQIPDDCIRTTIALRAQRPGTTILVNYSCWNYSSESYSLIYTTAALANAYLYEQNLTRTQNNSLVKIVPFGLTTCSTGSPLLYYSCWNELDGGSETCDYDQTFILNTTAGNLIQTFTGSASAWTICVTPSTLEGNISSTEEIGGAAFDTRFFYIFGSVINVSSPYNLTRWVGDAATTKLTFAYVKRAGVGVPNYYIYVQRLFIDEDTFKTVGMGKTGEDGGAPIYLEPNDAFYRFVVVDGDGTVVYTSSTQQVGCAASVSYCTVTLNIETSNIAFWDYHNGISSTCTFDNTTKIISCSFVVADGTDHYFQLDVYRWAQYGNKTLNCTANTTTSAGTLWCDMGDASTTGTFVYYLGSYSTGLILQEGSVNWAALASWGTTGLFIALCIIMVLGLLGTHFGPSASMLLAYVGFVICTFMEFIHIDLYGLVGLGVVVGVLVYVIKH